MLWSRGWGAGISALFVLGAVVFASVRANSGIAAGCLGCFSA